MRSKRYRYIHTYSRRQSPYTIEKIEILLLLLDNIQSNSPHPLHSEDYVTVLAESVCYDRQEWTWARSQLLNMSNATICHILRKVTCLYCHRFNFHASEKLEKEPLVSTKILLNDDSELQLRK